MSGVAMEILSASEARAKLFSLVEQVNQDHLPREIISRKGNAVLLSVPGLVQAVQAAEQANDWVSEEEFLEHLNGTDDSVSRQVLARSDYKGNCDSIDSVLLRFDDPVI